MQIEQIPERQVAVEVAPQSDAKAIFPACKLSASASASATA